MDSEDKKLLEDIYELTKENNEMLHKVRGVQKRQTFFQIVHWLFIVGIAIGALYFLQPYIDQFQNFINEVSLTFEKFKNIIPK